MIRRPPSSTRTDTLFPYTTLFLSHVERIDLAFDRVALPVGAAVGGEIERAAIARPAQETAVVIGAESQLARRAAGRGDEKDLLEARLEIALAIGAIGEEVAAFRSEARRVGNESGSTCRSWGSPYHYKNKLKIKPRHK